MSNTEDKSPEVASGFLSHLIELRDRLLRVVIALGVLFVALYPFNDKIFNWLAASLVAQKYTLININPIESVLVPMKLTLLVAFLIALPYILYQLWSFIAPGLYKHEKRLIYPLLVSSVFLFFLGIIFVYYIILPMVFIVLPKFLPAIAVFQPDIGFFLSFATVMFLAFGFGFEIPIVTILLISTGITTAEKLKEKRPYVIVGAFVIGMLLTPPDVVSQIMLAIPMWILFELGLIFSKFFNVRIKEAGEAKAERNKAQEDKDKAAATSAAFLPPDDLWAEDDLYTYEEDSDANDRAENDDEERSILGDDSSEEPADDDDTGTDVDTDNSEEDSFFEAEDYDELSDEEMEAELDRIEALEEAEKAVKKKAKKRAKTKKSQKKKDKKPKK